MSVWLWATAALLTSRSSCDRPTKIQPSNLSPEAPTRQFNVWAKTPCFFFLMHKSLCYFNEHSEALFRLWANQIRFLNHMFKEDCPHCYLQVIRLELCVCDTNLFALAIVIRKKVPIVYVFHTLSIENGNPLKKTGTKESELNVGTEKQHPAPLNVAWIWFKSWFHVSLKI